MEFRDHFSAQAALYAQARPQYPPALFAWLAGQCPDRRQAWDAGCGNGQASVALVEYFEEVFASDPSASQIANAPQTPGVRFLVEPAEACSLPDGRQRGAGHRGAGLSLVRPARRSRPHRWRRRPSP